MSQESKTLSKTEMVEKALKDNPNGTANDIVEAVKKEHKVDVSLPTVYQVKRGDKPAKAKKDEALSTEDALLVVKATASKVGGVDRLIDLAKTFKALAA